MARFFFDLDGVLADFDAGCVRALGSGPKDYIEAHGERVFWKRVAATSGFYVHLDWMPGGADMFEAARSIAEENGDVVMVLTGLPLGDWAAPQKRLWVMREMLGVPVICCLSRDKSKYCNPGDVLLDDRAEAAVPWHEAGGIFIHHTSPAASLAAIAAHYG